MNRILKRIAEDNTEINNTEDEELFEKYQRALNGIKEFDKRVHELIEDPKLKEEIEDINFSSSTIYNALYKVIFALNRVYNDINKAQYRRFKK